MSGYTVVMNKENPFDPHCAYIIHLSPKSCATHLYCLAPETSYSTLKHIMFNPAQQVNCCSVKRSKKGKSRGRRRRSGRGRTGRPSVYPPVYEFKYALNYSRGIYSSSYVALLYFVSAKILKTILTSTDY